MATRCNGCDGKFGSNGEAEIEIDSVDIDDDGYITGSVTINIPCGNCGDELKTGMLEFEHQLDVEAHEQECTFTVDEIGEIAALSDGASDEETDAYHEAVQAAGGRSFEIISQDGEASDDYRPQFKTKKDGTPVLDKQGNRVRTPMRYQTHYYGAVLNLVVRCSLCDGDIDVEVQDDMPASSLEDAQ